MVFSTACFLGYFWSTYIVPETGNVSLEEMDEVFGSSAAAEDNNLKHQVRQSFSHTNQIHCPYVVSHGMVD